MIELPAEIKRRREVEDAAIRLGQERSELQDRIDKIIVEAVDLMAEGRRKGVPVARLAELLGIDRPTLYRWEKARAVHRAHHAERKTERR